MISEEVEFRQGCSEVLDRDCANFGEDLFHAIR